MRSGWRTIWQWPRGRAPQLDRSRQMVAPSVSTGKRSAAAALKAWAARANAKRSIAEIRAALKDSLKEEAAGKGRRFGRGREAIRWLES